jgi:uncharacterized protein (TIGR02996 family)
MTDEPALLAAIREHPDEDTPRLAYADWLDEHNRHERAEFIRAQVQLARLPDDDPRRTDLEVTERRLLAKNCVEWAAPWPAFQNWEYAGDGPSRAIFRRGFLDAVDGFVVSPSAPTGGYAGLLDVHPIRETAVVGHSLADLATGLSWPGWSRIESLSVALWYNGREAPAHFREQFHRVDAFLRHANLTRLRRLSVGLPGIHERDIRHWFRLPVVRQLSALSLAVSSVNSPSTGEAIAELTDGEFPNLRTLLLTTSGRPDCARALRRFVGSDMWKRVTHFSLFGDFPWVEALATARLESLTVNYGTDPNALRTFVNALCMAEPATLEELRLNGPGVPRGADLSRLLAAPGLANLRRLSFWQAQLSDDDITRVAEAPVLGHLNRLTITHNYAVSAALETLYASPDLHNLTCLHVSGRPTPDAVRALACNDSARHLRELSLGSLTTPSALGALTSGSAFPDVHTVEFHLDRSTPDRTTMEAFLNSPKLPRLCVAPFSVYHDRVQELAPIFRACGRIAWAGGEMIDGGDGTRVAVVPEDVYLPNHLDGLSGMTW